MKKIKKEKIILMVVAFVIAFAVASVLLWTPQAKYRYDVETFETVSELKPSDITVLNNCQIDSEGYISVIGEDSFIVFGNLSEGYPMIKLNFAKPLESDLELEVFINAGYGFNEGLKVKQLCDKGDTYAYIFIGAYDYYDLRIDMDANYQLEGVERGMVEMDKINLTNRPFWPLYASVAGALFAIIIYFVDIKKNLIESISKKVAYYKQNFVKGLLSLGVITGCALIITLVWRGIPSLDLFGVYTFAIAFAFVFSALCGVASLWFHRKSLVEDIEKVFVKLLLFAGIAMIFVTPLAHACWDTESHYRWALEASYLGDTHWTQADLFVINLGDASLMKGDPYQHFQNAGMLTASHQGVVNSYEVGVSWSHLPSGIFIAIARVLGLPFMVLFMFGKLANLLSYTLLCYLGMRKLKSGKMVLAVIAFFPTSIFLASNYAYDWWVTGFSILGTAYFVGALQRREEKISTWDICVMCASMAIACVPKTIYFPLLLLPLLMPQDKIKNKKVYYIICVLAFVLLMSKFISISATTTAGTGDLRGGETVGPGDQLSYIFSDIFGYAFMLLNFLATQYLNVGNMPAYISNFAYLGIASGTTVIVALLVLNILFDHDEVYVCKDKFVWLSRIYVILMYVGGSAMVATSMYVAFTPVGSSTIAGCQARYIIPWLYPMLSIWSMNRIKPIIPKKVLYLITMVGCYGMLFYQLYTVFLPKVIVMY